MGDTLHKAPRRKDNAKDQKSAKAGIRFPYLSDLAWHNYLDYQSVKETGPKLTPARFECGLTVEPKADYAKTQDPGGPDPSRDRQD